MKKLRPAVMAVFLNDKGKILIGSSPRDGGYKIPQGGMESGETPLQALIREVEEELGVVLTEKDVHPYNGAKTSYMYPSSEPLRNQYTGQELHVFLIRYRDSMNPTPQDDEFDKLLWINPSDLHMYDTQHRAEAYRKGLAFYNL